MSSPSPADDNPTESPRSDLLAGPDDRDAEADPKGRKQRGTSPPSDPPGLPILGRDLTLRGTVWIPRILWALEWARHKRRAPLSAADIARVLTEHGGLAVARHNVARAFRDHRNDAAVARLWASAGRGYEITTAGTRMLETLLNDDGGA